MPATFLETNNGNTLSPTITSRSNERGAAMIVVLFMLLLLTIIGATLLATSTTDLQIAGNYRNNQKAFYINDYGYEILKSPDLAAVFLGMGENKANYRKIVMDLPPDLTGTVSTVTTVINYTGCSTLATPGTSSELPAKYFTVEIVGTAPNNATVSTTVGILDQDLDFTVCPTN